MTKQITIKKVFAFARRWSEEQECRLIDLLQTREYIWNTSHELYKNRNHKRQGYQNIAFELSTAFPNDFATLTGDEVAKKFSKMRSYYLSQKRDEAKFKSSSGADCFTPSWRHYERLQFLDEAYFALSSDSNLDNSVCLDSSQSSSTPSFKVEDLSQNSCSSQSPTAVAELESSSNDYHNMDGLDNEEEENVSGTSVLKESATLHLYERRQRNTGGSNSTKEKLLQATTEVSKTPVKIKEPEQKKSVDRAFCDYVCSVLEAEEDEGRKRKIRTDIFNLLNKNVYSPD